MQILTVGAIAAASKTYNAICFAVAGVRAGEKFIFCVPSTDLALQIERDCRKAGCSAVIAIHTEARDGGAVVARLMSIFKLHIQIAAKS